MIFTLLLSEQCHEKMCIAFVTSKGIDQPVHRSSLCCWASRFESQPGCKPGPQVSAMQHRMVLVVSFFEFFLFASLLLYLI